MSDLKLDPLFEIFETHLYDFNDDTETEEDFIAKVVTDYLRFLDTNGAIVPPKMRIFITEELNDQVKKMLTKKMYGCLSIKEYLNTRVKNGAVAGPQKKNKPRRFTTLFKKKAG